MHVYCGILCAIHASAGGHAKGEPSSLLTERALETIRLLRRELERCHGDLQTDEELFAEKTEELSQLQSAYSLLLKEKGRLEEAWLASQENEGLLESEVYQLKEHLSVMAAQLAEREEREGERNGASLQSAAGCVEKEESDSLEEIKQSESIL